MDSPLLEQKRQGLRALGDSAHSLQFDALLVRLSHSAPLPHLRDVEPARLHSHAPELTPFKIVQGPRFVEHIEAESPKGKGPPLGKMTRALSI